MKRLKNPHSEIEGGLKVKIKQKSNIPKDLPSVVGQVNHTLKIKQYAKDKLMENPISFDKLYNQLMTEISNPDAMSVFGLNREELTNRCLNIASLSEFFKEEYINTPSYLDELYYLHTESEEEEKEVDQLIRLLQIAHLSSHSSVRMVLDKMNKSVIYDPSNNTYIFSAQSGLLSVDDQQWVNDILTSNLRFVTINQGVYGIIVARDLVPRFLNELSPKKQRKLLQAIFSPNESLDPRDDFDAVFEVDDKVAKEFFDQEVIVKNSQNKNSKDKNQFLDQLIASKAYSREIDRIGLDSLVEVVEFFGAFRNKITKQELIVMGRVEGFNLDQMIKGEYILPKLEIRRMVSEFLPFLYDSLKLIKQAIKSLNNLENDEYIEERRKAMSNHLIRLKKLIDFGLDIEDGVSFKSRTMPLWFTEVITSIFYSHTFFSDGIIVEMGWNYEFDM
ncbi:MAG: hypothetical protein ACRCXZ_11000, partial [Patescibacteria group bacterium]